MPLALLMDLGLVSRNCSSDCRQPWARCPTIQTKPAVGGGIWWCKQPFHRAPLLHPENQHFFPSVSIASKRLIGCGSCQDSQDVGSPAGTASPKLGQLLLLLLLSVATDDVRAAEHRSGAQEFDFGLN